MSSFEATNSRGIYLIFSHKTLEALNELLEGYGAKVDLLRVMYGQQHRETNRTLAVFSRETYERLKADGYCDQNDSQDVRIVNYELRAVDYPSQGYQPLLFIPVPNAVSHNERVIDKFINMRFERLAKWGLLPANSWSVKVPLKTRTYGGVRGGCTVSFNDDVPKESIALARLLLTDTTWEEVGNHDVNLHFVCHWARDPTFYKSPDNQYKESRESRDSRSHWDQSVNTDHHFSPEKSTRSDLKEGGQKKFDKVQRLLKGAVPSDGKKKKKVQKPKLVRQAQPSLAE